MHTTYFSLNNEMSLEPRIGLSWRPGENVRLSAGSGIHSQIEPFGVYLLEKRVDNITVRDNTSLQLSKSWHNVLGYSHVISRHLHFNAEMYYHKGFDIPVADTPGNPFSVINTYYLYDVYSNSNGLVSSGATTNYGIDISLERTHAGGYYFLITGSLFDARYTARNGTQFNSRYNTRYMLNLLGGIEKKIGSKNKTLLNLNARFVLGGGNRFTPVQEVTQGTRQYFAHDPTQVYELQLSPYYRVDASINLTLNRPFISHAFYLDVQNIIHHKNEGFVEFDSRQRRFTTTKLLGVLPILGYRINF